MQNNQLILEGERKAPETFKNNANAQLAYGKFYAAVTLPNGLNVDKLNARLQDGILDIQIPVSEQMKPRQIQIQSGEIPQGHFGLAATLVHSSGGAISHSFCHELAANRSRIFGAIPASEARDC